MIVHLVDGTYELFRHFYGVRRFKKTDPPFGAVGGVLRGVLQLINDGATHIGVATDHVIESFRNDLWPGYNAKISDEAFDTFFDVAFSDRRGAYSDAALARWACSRKAASDPTGRCRTMPGFALHLSLRFSAEPFHRGRAGFIHTIETCLGVAVARQ